MSSSSGPIVTRDDCVCLSTSAVVNQQAFMSNCGIPIAALIDLRPPAKTRLSQIARQPCRCSSCGAFLNCYCKTSLSKTGEPEWTCILCGTTNAATFLARDLGDNTKSLAELSDEAVEYVYPAPPPSPALQQHKRAHIVLLVDATMEPGMISDLSHSILTDLLPSLDPRATLSLISFDRCVCLHSLSPSSSSSLTIPGGQAADRSLISQYVSGSIRGPQCDEEGQSSSSSSSSHLVVDVASCSSALASALKSIRPMDKDLPLEERPRCLGPAIETALWLMHYSSQPTPTQDGSKAPAPATPSSLPSFSHLPRGSCIVAALGGPATQGPGAVSIEALRAAAPFYVDLSPNANANNGSGNRSSSSSSSSAPPLILPRGSTRSAKEMKKEASAAVDYFGSLADLAEDMGVPISLLLLTTTSSASHKKPSGGNQAAENEDAEKMSVSFNVPALSMLAQDTKGLLIPCPTPSNPLVLGSSLKAAAAGAMATGGTSAPSSCFGSSGILDAYASEGLKLVQWLGPVDLLQAADVEDEPSLSMAHDTRLSHSACSVIRLQEGHGAALRVELDRDLPLVDEGGGPEPFVVLQVVLQFVDPSIGSRLVQRVCTRKMRVVSGLSAFLQGLDPLAAAVAIAKRSALEAKKQYALCHPDKAEGVRYALRAQLGLVASRCCREEVVVGKGGLFTLGLGVVKAKKLHPELQPIARTMHSIVSGSLLAPPRDQPSSKGEEEGQLASLVFSPDNADARLLGANALLSAGSEATLAMLMPPDLYPGSDSPSALSPGALIQLYSASRTESGGKSPHRVPFDAWCLANGIKV